MNTLCIVSLFFAAVFGMPIQNMKDPKSFVATTQEGAADEILQMIETLRGENADAMEHATNALSGAQADHDSTQSTLERTTLEEDQALGNVEEGDKWFVILTNKAHGAAAVEADAAGKKQAAQDASDKAAAFLASETERLDDEKATLDEVIDLITTLAESAELQVSDSRQLLSIVDLSSLANADPTAVAEVKQLLEDLVQTGEDERQKATDDDAAATAALDAATAAYTLTYDALAVALGKVDFQEETNADLADIAAAAVAAKNSARNAHNNAVQVLGNAQHHFDEETARTTDEEDTFSKVEALMGTLSL